MKRVVPTSAGYLEIDFSGKGWGSVAVYDVDGWGVEGGVWGMKGYPADAREVVGRLTALSAAEIDQLVQETEEQYEEKGGDAAALEASRLPTGLRRAVLGLGLRGVFVVAFLVFVLVVF